MIESILIENYKSQLIFLDVMADFIKSLENLKSEIESDIKHGVDLGRAANARKEMVSYELKKESYYRNAFEKALKTFKSDCLDLNQLVKYDIQNQRFVNEILELVPELDTKDLEKLKKLVKKIDLLAKQMNIPKEVRIEKEFKISFIPFDIKADVMADVNELNKCFNAGCYRSCVILCGRLLEIGLHRKYYDVTNEDILEKAPGIGLGNLIARLRDKKVNLDPALTNQIHLINEARVFSVHKKKEAFYPSKEQAHAIILYTIDVLEKLFKK